MKDRRSTRLGSRSPQTALAVVLAVAAGVSTGLMSTTALLVLGIIALAAFLIVFKTPQASLWAIAVAALASAVAIRLPELTLEAFVQGVVWGLLVVLILGASLTLRRVVEQYQAFQQRGWEIAMLQAKRQASETRETLQRERMSLAAEMHDGLGHTLTLIAVRLGQLSVTPTLTATDRQHVVETRQLAADAAEELGLAVRLLRSPNNAPTHWTTPALQDLVEQAQQVGIQVTADVSDQFDEDLSQEVRTAILHTVQEGLTNAAKHAPGQPVRVEIASFKDEIRAVISTKLTATRDAPSDRGFGLIGLRHRAEMLGGELTVEQSSLHHTLTVTLPRHARPVAPVEERIHRVEQSKTTIADHRSKAARLAVALPTAVITTMIFVVTAYFMLVSTLSAMTPATFQSIDVGDEQSTTEQVLPQFEIFDPPRDEFPARPNEECSYYESGISFFERLEVFVICFSNDHVSRKGTVPAS